MKTVRINKPKEIEVTQTEIPIPKENEALLKIKYGGICGSDLGSYRGTFAYFEYPKTPGHELSAEIVEIDSENEYGLKPGMVVTVNPYFNCGKCYSCKRGLVNACTTNQTMGVQREGGFAEYITMPLERIINGYGISAKIMTLIEPFSISYHGVKRAKISSSDKVLIVGAGTIGVLAAFAAKIFGAEVYISDISKEKLEYAKRFDVDGTILNDNKEEFDRKVTEITGGNGFDVTIEAVGLPSTFQDCIDAASFGGRVVLIGVGKKNLDFNFTIIQKKELNIFGSRNAVTEDFVELINFIRQGKVELDKIVTDVYHFDDVKDAFKDFDTNGHKMLKVLVEF